MGVNARTVDFCPHRVHEVIPGVNGGVQERQDGMGYSGQEGSKAGKGHAMTRRRTFLEDRPLGIEPPREVTGRVEISLPTINEIRYPTVDWVGVELMENTVYLVTKVEWRADGDGEWNPDPRGHVRAEGWLYMSEDGWRAFGVLLTSGEDPLNMFEEAWQLVWQAGFEFADPKFDDVTANLRVAMTGSFNSPRIERMASEEEAGNLWSRGSQGTERGVERNEGSVRDRESANPEGTKEDGKDLSMGENLGKVGGSKRGSQESKEGRDKERSSPRNSDGVISKKVKVSDVRRKLAEIEKRTVEYKAKLIEEMMAGNEGDRPGEEPREERRTSQGGIGHGRKDSSHRRTPSKRGKEKGDSPDVEAKKVANPPAIDSGASRLPAAPKITKGCDGLWCLRERVLGWFDPEGTTKTRERQKDSKEEERTSTAGETGSSEGGLKKIVSTLTRALNKNQGYLADAKRKLTFDGANITEFLIDYENLAALLKWSEEENMDHLGQHVSLSLERDIMAIVAASGSWKETRNEMMRKYLKAEKMATEAELAVIQRKQLTTTS
ncbi:hypothetical protein CBR_g48831 [Chara braunii]|uniref:Uncharacterized protein n=1 Tax=Chara braunii TaxID=69332 RepID=A0A388M3K3_CHABU|nr:hypothetical protein CBR_g48831 [Chara braunii]|eukprot:GBG89121.1 hypothetical protein CBR_g48831 [Chara braunii]